ncbi:hypothetical protein [Calidifontibacter indicus]|uniref:hypothetical protein n=1 Tax=Calidifontibacter indicus TaxID=419650 RepID=UPI003D71E7DA
MDLNESEASIFLDGDAKGEVLGAPDLSRGHDESTRTIKLGLVIDEQHESVVSQVANAVQRDDVWLHWQRNSNSAPVWFKLLGVPAGGLNMDLVLLEGEGFYEWNLTLLAEGFAYGARVSETITMAYRKWDGAADADDTITKRLAPIKGDAPARVRVDITPKNGAMSGWSPWLNITAIPATYGMPGAYLWQLEGMTPGAGYTRQKISFGGPDPTAGTPNNVLKTSGTQNTQYGGANCSNGAAPDRPDPARYVMLLRLITGNTQALAPSYRWGVLTDSSGALFGLWRTWRKPAKSSQFAGWLPLDGFSIPAGINPAEVKSGETLTPIVGLWHQGDGTATDVYVDKMLLLMAEPSEGVAYNLQVVAPSDTWGMVDANRSLRFDDVVDRVGVRYGNAWWQNDNPPKINGAYPYVTPGLVNWLTFIPNTDTLGGDDSAGTDEFDVTVSYHPRYLHLAAS